MTSLELYGYLGSTLVAVSLMMSNIVALRWINLVGASLFASYGLMIHAWPVAALNCFIVMIDLYHLWHIYRSNKNIRITRLAINNPYVTDILAIKWPEINQFTHNTELQITFEGNEPKHFEVVT